VNSATGEGPGFAEINAGTNLSRSPNSTQDARGIIRSASSCYFERKCKAVNHLVTITRLFTVANNPLVSIAPFGWFARR
jgi:hypothetical protein